MSKVGSWAFIIGIIIALLVGIFSSTNNTLTMSLLIVLGLIVGFLNVTERETMPFLFATIALVIVANFGGNIVGKVSRIGPYLSGVLGAIMAFVIPATIIVAIKQIYNLARK